MKSNITLIYQNCQLLRSMIPLHGGQQIKPNILYCINGNEVSFYSSHLCTIRKTFF